MAQDTASLERIIRLADRLRKEWAAGNARLVRSLVGAESRENVGLLVCLLLNDLEAASGE